jgi:hypothetical protein
MNDYDVIVIGRAAAALEVNIPNYCHCDHK